MPIKYWTPSEIKTLKELAKAGEPLSVVSKKLPERTIWAIVMKARDLSVLNTPSQDKEFQKRKQDQTLTARQVYNEFGSSWDKMQDDELVCLFLKPISIDDISSKMGRAPSSVNRRMQEICKERHGVLSEIWEKMSMYLRLIPIQN